MPASDGTISVTEMHGEKNAEAFLAMSTAELFAQFALGGKEQQAAALEYTRRKFNRAVRKRDVS